MAPEVYLPSIGSVIEQIAKAQVKLNNYKIQHPQEVALYEKSLEEASQIPETQPEKYNAAITALQKEDYFRLQHNLNCLKIHLQELTDV